MRMKLPILILSLITYLSSFAQSYKGTIGKFPIYLNIEHFSDEDIEASYFYTNQLKNIKLKAEITPNGYKLYLKYSKPEEKKELFILENKENKLVGEWINEETTLPVVLNNVKVDFESFKQKKLKLVRGKTQKFENLEIVWFKEKYSNVELFRLGNGFNKKQREFLNFKLDSIQNDYSLRKLECEEYETSFHIKLLTEKLISFTESFSVYCGGAYPSHGIGHYNYDLTKNKEIQNLSELYPNLNFVDFLKKKYKNRDLDPECEFFEPSNSNVWEFAQFHLTKTAIIIEPSHPHAMAPCREYFEILKLEIENK